MTALALPLTDLSRLKRRVAALAENRPGVYRMLDHAGRVIYVGKAKRVRARVLSYFRAAPDDKAGRILQAAADLTWDYAPSEFSACLRELRDIRKFRPPYNVRMNRARRIALIKVSTGPAPKVHIGRQATTADDRVYGPYPSIAHTRDAVRVLNDLLGLRDCALDMPMVFAEQGDLFAVARRAACFRYDIGTCSGPCAGFIAERDYRARVDHAVALLEGREVEPLRRVVAEMTEASAAQNFEQAVRWRDRFDALEWLFGAAIRARAAIEALTFIYYDPGTFGDDRVYLIRRATVRAQAPAPDSPIERDAWRGVVESEVTGAGGAGGAAGADTNVGADSCAPLQNDHWGPIPADDLDETLLLLSWFRRHPAAMRRTKPIESILAENT